MKHRVIPLRSHYSISDLVLASATKELHKGVSSGAVESPELSEVQKFYMERLENAADTVPFKHLSMSIQLASNLSSHDMDPFVHVFTSMPDQGTGTLDLLYARKRIAQELMFSSGESSNIYDTLSSMEQDIDQKISRIESSSSMIDGSIQVPMGEFFEDKDFGAIVSEAKDFRIFVPDLFASKTPNDSKEFSFGSEQLYPSDSTVYFQVHSRVKNHDGNNSYELTGTGHIHLSTMIKRVLQEKRKARSREEAEFVSLEIPLILNCVSSQSPDAKLVDNVSKTSRTRVENIDQENKALYEGSLFVHVHLDDEETSHFFSSFAKGKEKMFEVPHKRDITEGNFSHVANTMRYHVIRDMSPFIPEFTASIPISVELSPLSEGEEYSNQRNIGDSVIKETKGWVFQPSLKEGERIHAPYNKGTTHTTPGFTYYHDKMMQRLPDTRFILENTRIVLGRWGMSEKEFVQATKKIVQKTERGEMYLDPHYVDVLNITSEVLCAFPTSMNYRGDYADMNTTIREGIAKTHGYFEHLENVHHMEHATGLTRVPAVAPKHRSKWHNPWDKTKKTGTEMFGDAVIDRSGDCEDFAKLINRMIAGIKACNTSHPLVVSLQSVLNRYSAYSVLSSVTSASIMTAPSKDDGSSKSKLADQLSSFSSHENAGAEVGSPKDLKAGIGAHMFTILIPKKMEERALKATQGSSLISSSSHRSREEEREPDEETFIEDTIPPMVLEGTGPARALLLAQETYHKTIPNKVRAINGEMLRIEATARLMTGMPTEQVTSQGLRQANAIFSPFVLPIRNNNLVDADVDERASAFYRMPVEMFAIEDGFTDVRVTPKEVVSVQKEINAKKTQGKSFMMDINLYSSEESQSDAKSDYFLSRVIPVQLKPRSKLDAIEHSADPVIGYTYGVNMTDIAHRREDIFGLLKTIRSSEEENQVIDDVMRHANPSAIIQIAPEREVVHAKKLAARYEAMLNENIQDTLSRGYMGREGDLHTINLYVRTDNIKDAQMKRLAEHLAKNGYVGQEPVRVVPESFARGHHLLRLSIPVDVTEAKQLYLESNALAENLNIPSDKRSRKEREEAIQREEKKILVKYLKKVLSGR